jgi:short subunit dehydrogenase-like uncharacterized protein
MKLKRMATLAASTLLLAACSMSTGIVDNFAPPQPSVQTQSRVADCAEVQATTSTPGTPSETVVQNQSPCVVETVASLVTGQVRDRQRDASRPGRLTPPRFPRFIR